MNLAEGIPAERRRQALLKIIELSMAQNQIPQAAKTLENFLSQYPDAALADLALLTLGELRLRQYEFQWQAFADWMKEKHADVLTLRDVEGLSNEETAKILDLSVAAVKSRLHRGRMYLRDRFEAAFKP